MEMRAGQSQRGSGGEGAAACDDPEEKFAIGGLNSVLLRLFDEKQAGFYVDVGGAKPRRRVDCLRRQLGWSGISICTSAEGRCTLVESLSHDVDFELATFADNERPAELNGGDRKLNGENWNGAQDYPGGAASLHAPAVLNASSNGTSGSSQSLYDILSGHLPPGRPIDLLNVDGGAASLAVLMSNDWRRFRSTVLTVEDPALGRIGASAIRRLAEAEGYELIGHLFGMSIYALPKFLERVGRGNSPASFLKEMNGDSASPALSTVAKRHPGAMRAEHHAAATAQLDHLRRQLDATRAELEVARAEQSVLRSSLAWRIAEPIYRIEARIAEWRSGLDQQSTEGEPPEAPPQFDLKVAKAAYDASPLAAEPDSFVLYRIIGNDLKPRHRSGQSRDNVAFMLDHEPKFPDCEKRWVVNRIYSRDAEAAIIELLERHQQRYMRIPFVLDEYAAIELALEDFPEPGFFLGQQYSRLVDAAKLRARMHVRWRKNAYVMNNNGARNAALAEGRKIAKWVLPWDGNCFLTKEAWEKIRAGVVARPYLPYFAVPMARLSDNDNFALIRNKPRGAAAEEPQVIFRKDALEAFDERFVYGRRSKVELLARLGVSGHWDNWMTYRLLGPRTRPPRSGDRRRHESRLGGATEFRDAGTRSRDRIIPASRQGPLGGNHRDPQRS